MAKRKRDREGFCPACGKESVDPSYDSAELDGDGCEIAPYKCSSCGATGKSIRVLEFSHYEED